VTEPAKTEPAVKETALKEPAPAELSKTQPANTEVAKTEPATEPAVTETAPAPEPRSAAELRAADPFGLSEEEIDRDLATLADLPGERARLAKAHAAAILERDTALKALTAKVNQALDAKRSFEERWVDLGERLRLLQEAKAKLRRDAELARERAEADAAFKSEQARQKELRELQARKDQMSDSELRALREKRQAALAGQRG